MKQVANDRQVRQINKRQMLQLVVLVITAVVTMLILIDRQKPQSNHNSPQPKTATNENTQNTTSGNDTSTSSCQSSLTASTTAGPYYVKNTRPLTNGELNYDNLDGERIKIYGHVFDGSGEDQPLKNAYVDIWQADSEGRYWPEGNKDASTYNDGEISLRGGVFTNENGYFAFTTIYPGEYEGRARHIHIHVSSASGDKEVVSQLIMSKPGDKTPATEDAIARRLPRCNTIEFSTIDGTPTGRFDLHI